METKIHENSIKLHTHTHTHICYKIIAEISFHAKITKTGNDKINKNLVDSG